MPIVNAASEAGKKLVEKLQLADSPIYLVALASCYSLTTICGTIAGEQFVVIAALVFAVLLWTVFTALRRKGDEAAERTIQVVRGSALAATVVIACHHAEGTQYQPIAFWGTLGMAIANGLFFLLLKPERVLRSRFSGRYVTLTLLASLTLFTASHCASQFAFRFQIMQLESQQIESAQLQDIYSVMAKMEPALSIKGAIYSVHAAETIERESYKLTDGVVTELANYLIIAVAVSGSWLLVILGVVRLAFTGKPATAD